MLTLRSYGGHMRIQHSIYGGHSGRVRGDKRALHKRPRKRRSPDLSQTSSSSVPVEIVEEIEGVTHPALASSLRVVGLFLDEGGVMVVLANGSARWTAKLTGHLAPG